jgi:hypothetical protein
MGKDLSPGEGEIGVNLDEVSFLGSRVDEATDEIPSVARPDGRVGIAVRRPGYDRRDIQEILAQDAFPVQAEFRKILPGAMIGKDKIPVGKGKDGITRRRLAVEGVNLFDAVTGGTGA